MDDRNSLQYADADAESANPTNPAEAIKTEPTDSLNHDLESADHDLESVDHDIEFADRGISDAERTNHAESIPLQLLNDNKTLIRVRRPLYTQQEFDDAYQVCDRKTQTCSSW